MAPKFKYRGDLTCAIQVSDLNKASAWFRDQLGFEELFRHEEGGWCEVKTSTPGVSIGFSQVENPEVGKGTTLVFGVEDIEATRSELEQKGVRFEGDIIDIPGLVRLTTFLDPDGNKFMFSQTPKA